MANGIYDKGREAFLNADIDWLVDDIREILVDVADYTVNLATHQFLSDVPAIARVAVSGAIAGKSSTNGVANHTVTTWASVTGDPSEAIVVYKHTGVEGTSLLIAYIDTATGLPVTPNGGNITFTPDAGANKLFKL